MHLGVLSCSPGLHMSSHQHLEDNSVVGHQVVTNSCIITESCC